MPPKPQTDLGAKAPPPSLLDEQPPAVDKQPENSGLVAEATAQPPAPPPAAARMPVGWTAMEHAPHNRPIWTTADPYEDPAGTLSFWRITREKNRPGRGWSTKEFWAAVLTRRALEFEPTAWRESSSGAALAAALEAEMEVA